MALVRACCDEVEVVGLDEAYLDLSGLPAPHAAMRRLAHEIAAVGMTCSIGIGPNKLVDFRHARRGEAARGFVVLKHPRAVPRSASRSRPAG